MTTDRFEQLLRDSELRLTAQINDVKQDVAEIRKDVRDAQTAAAGAAQFGNNAQAAAKLLGFILAIVVAVATTYGVFH